MYDCTCVDVHSFVCFMSTVTMVDFNVSARSAGRGSNSSPAVCTCGNCPG